MKHPLLDPHACIAWDMDETLVNGPNSAFFCAYIRSHPEKQHHVVTFRTGRAWIASIPSELARYGVEPGMIAGVHSVPEELYFAYAQAETFHQPEKVEAYLHYKGLTAKKIGATVLVDDLEMMVTPGCTAHGIAYVDAHGPFPVIGGAPRDSEDWMD